ncbi:HlyD family secretion protein [Fontimonas sp. SYSU GA230001]|uniref:HlyD family secretion protein n=1 Tax=Fontimonas sp. SYSU GA230001 TaxID=3142450 RepID=UPI0032B352DA
MSEESPAPADRSLLPPRWRRPLLIAGPATVALIAAGLWLFGGRYVSTDDAYVKSNKVNVSAELAGAVAQVLVAENQPVSRGTPLLQLDRRPFEVAVAQAQANLLQTRIHIESLRAAYGQKAAALSRARSDLDYQRTQQRRVEELFRQRVVARSALDAAHHDYEVAHNRVAELEHDLDQATANLNGDADAPTERHPAWLAAQAALDKAQLDLERTTVRAPIDGVASKVPEPGTYAMPGLPLLALVADDESWVEANFKESELERVRAGQPVRVAIDAYPGHVWQGTVASIGQATGAEFSLLPPQNASGNWVKVVQRIPVRVQLRHEGDEPPLRAGMSAVIRVDTGHAPRALLALRTLGLNDAQAGTR